MSNNVAFGKAEEPIQLFSPSLPQGGNRIEAPFTVGPVGPLKCGLAIKPAVKFQRPSPTFPH